MWIWHKTCRDPICSVPSFYLLKARKLHRVAKSITYRPAEKRAGNTRCTGIHTGMFVLLTIRIVGSDT